MLKKLPGAQQVMCCMLAGRVLQYKRIRELSTNAKSDEQVLPELEKIAVLIKGVWVVKSQALQATNNWTPRQVAIRDYLLYLLHSQEYVSRDAFAKKCGLSVDEGKELLDELTVLVRGRGRKLKVEPDEEFLEMYPEVVQRQNRIWEERKKM